MLVVLIAGLIRPAGVWADASACERAIAKAAAAYVQGRMKAVARCEEGKLKGRLRPSDSCTADPATAQSIWGLRVKLFAEINRSCGGENRDCGDADDVPLAATGWGGVTTCPAIGGGGCVTTISSCTDISVCLSCIADRAVDQAVATYAGEFDPAFGTSNPANRCQMAINKGAAKLIAARSKVLQRCWDARLRGGHGNPCPDPGDGRAVKGLAKADAKMVNTVCAACGGPDGLCNGVGDLTPGAIGFTASCPDVSPRGGASCGGAILDLTDIVQCIDCVAAFDTDCADAAGVPGLVTPYPAACDAGGTTTTIPTSTTTSSTASTTTSSTASTTTSTTTTPTTTTTTEPPTTTTTISQTTTSTTLPSPTLLDFTFAAAGGVCGDSRDAAGTVLKSLTCGVLSIGGGGSIITDGPPPAGGTVSRFTLDCSGMSCTVGATAAVPPVNTSGPDCTTTGCYLGAPLPIPNASSPPLGTCLVKRWAQPATGTLDLATGTASLDIRLISDGYLTGASSCPKCSAVGSPGSPGSGTCIGGDRNGLGCTSTNSDGLTRDCLPANNTLLFSISANLWPVTTGMRTVTSTTGQFCSGQLPAQAGCFGSGACRTITETGAPAGAVAPGTPASVTLVSTFCAPATGTGVDGAVGLPGPGAVGFSGTFTIH